MGLESDHEAVRNLQDIVNSFLEIEKDAVKNLSKILRGNPLYPWIRAQRGIGDKQAARLLSTIGDPYWNDLHNRPRTVPELWAFCGLHVDNITGVAIRRAKGVKSNWSPNAKMRAFLVSTSVVKQLDARCKTETQVEHISGCPCAPLRVVYDARKLHTAFNLHQAPCVRCGPSGKPAQPLKPNKATPVPSKFLFDKVSCGV